MDPCVCWVKDGPKTLHHTYWDEEQSCYVYAHSTTTAHAPHQVEEGVFARSEHECLECPRKLACFSHRVE